MAVSENTTDALNHHFAKLMLRLANADSQALYDAAWLASDFRNRGHVCALLDARENFPDDFRERTSDVTSWLAELRATNVVGAPGEFTPLILDERARLYLWRYWDYEQRLVKALKTRMETDSSQIDEAILRDGLERYFGVANGEVDWQKLAAFAAMTQNLCVISGGPGTGKTRTIVTILALLLEQQPAGKKLRVALAAPTGKAAARMKESLKAARASLPEMICAQLPEEATTLHRLLGTIPNAARFRHDAANPLPLDLLVVDEASMVDLALMAKLLDAVPKRARVILVGDEDQLASVEAGNVFGDLCNAGRRVEIGSRLAENYARVMREKLPLTMNSAAAVMSNHVVVLRKNFRFGERSAIGELSVAVNAGDADLAVQILANDEEKMAVSEYGEGSARGVALPSRSALGERLQEIACENWRAFLEAKNPLEALRAFDDFRILCAVRKGTYGAESLNAQIEAALDLRRGSDSESAWYERRPIMVTSNDYRLNLFNGDIGVAFREKGDEAANGEPGDLRVWFLLADGALRKIAPSQLPPHETTFAMTVHKSQGSEFEKVLLVFPERENPALTRELLYTGITRARTSVEIWAHEAILRAAITRRTLRSSGLREAIWGE